MTDRCVVHETPGLLPPEAFTLFGASSKPSTQSPIGYFGTGLKFAIAVLMRHRCSVTVWLGEEPHIFSAEKTKFRDKEFLQIYMRRRRGVTARWMATQLPFTTELGRGWDLWMALRELHANTLDENGETFVLDSADDSRARGYAGSTRIVVEGEGYARAADELASIFLPADRRRVAEDSGVQVTEGHSEWAFYRGMRAHRLQHPSIYTWNLLHGELTEDRTLKHGFMVEYYARHLVKRSTDESFIRRVLTAKDDTFEATLNFSHLDEEGSVEFVKMARIYGKGRSAGTYAIYYDRVHAPPPKPDEDWRLTVLRVLENPEASDDLLLRTVKGYRAKLHDLIKSTMPKPAKEPDPSLSAPDIPF